jgi:hypothetical protein
VRTRTKILVGVGLLAAAVGVVWVRSPAKPTLEVSFVRYAAGGAVLAFTNKGNRPASWDLSSAGVMMRIETYGDSTHSLSDLSPGDGIQLVVRSDVIRRALPSPTPSPPLPATLSFQCFPQASPLRQRLEMILSKVGIDIHSTGSVVTVTLPPRETAPSPFPAH